MKNKLMRSLMMACGLCCHGVLANALVVVNRQSAGVLESMGSNAIPGANLENYIEPPHAFDQWLAASLEGLKLPITHATNDNGIKPWLPKHGREAAEPMQVEASGGYTLKMGWKRTLDELGFVAARRHFSHRAPVLTSRLKQHKEAVINQLKQHKAAVVTVVITLSIVGLLVWALLF
jgi:hypothetical protein